MKAPYGTPRARVLRVLEEERLDVVRASRPDDARSALRPVDDHRSRRQLRSISWIIFGYFLREVVDRSHLELVLRVRPQADHGAYSTFRIVRVVHHGPEDAFHTWFYFFFPHHDARAMELIRRLRPRPP